MRDFSRPMSDEVSRGSWVRWNEGATGTVAVCCFRRSKPTENFDHPTEQSGMRGGVHFFPVQLLTSIGVESFEDLVVEPRGFPKPVDVMQHALGAATGHIQT